MEERVMSTVSAYTENRQFAQLHRIKELCASEAVSIRAAARMLQISTDEAREQKNASADLTLSETYRWADLLGLPITDLLLDDGEPIRGAHARRSQYYRVAKTMHLLLKAPSAASHRVQLLNLDQRLRIAMPEYATAYDELLLVATPAHLFFFACADDAVSIPLPKIQRREVFHRLAEVRNEQGLSLRTVCRRLGDSMNQVRQQECETYDLRISQLYAWQAALEVPLWECIFAPVDGLEANVGSRAAMLVSAKLLKSILEPDNVFGEAKVLLELLVGQISECFPDFSGYMAEIGAMHTVGQRRSTDELGAIAYRAVPDSYFME